MKNYIVTTTTSSEQAQVPSVDLHKNVDEFWRVKYFHVLDSLIVNFLKKKRFSTESLKMAYAIDNFLKPDFVASLLFIEHYEIS